LTKQMGVVTTLSFVSIVQGYAISVFRYDEQVNWISLIGVLGIVVSIIGIIINRTKVLLIKDTNIKASDEKLNN